MKLLITTAVLASFIGIGVFGFVSIHFDGGHAVRCIASAVNGQSAPCPEVNPFAYAAFHTEALKKFSSAVFAALALVVLFVFAWSILGMISGLSVPLAYARRQETDDSFSDHFRRVATHWLALHEKRDPALSF
jgi:hypothetical protein